VPPTDRSTHIQTGHNTLQREKMQSLFEGNPIAVVVNVNYFSSLTGEQHNGQHAHSTTVNMPNTCPQHMQSTCPQHNSQHAHSTTVNMPNTCPQHNSQHAHSTTVNMPNTCPQHMQSTCPIHAHSTYRHDAVCAELHSDIRKETSVQSDRQTDRQTDRQKNL